MTENNDLTIVIPCFNEADNLSESLQPFVELCRKRNWEIVVVNDGSTDGTRDILQEMQSSVLRVVNHKVNRGYGGAIKTGILNTKTRLVVTVDADGQHYVTDVERLYDYFIEKDADMVVGMRENIPEASLLRGFGKLLIRSFVKFLMTIDIRDINSGMKMYRVDMARRFLHLCPDTMAYSDIILLSFVSQRCLVLEKPISLKPRIGGNSTISTQTALDTVAEILNIVILFNPMKIFFSISLVLFVLGIIWGGICFANSGLLSQTASLLIITSMLTFLMGLITEQLSRTRRNYHSREMIDD